MIGKAVAGIFFMILLWQVVPYSKAQDITTFINYTTDDGLPSSEVYRSFQDSHGFMWFATDRGVVRFDGYEFTVFNSDDGLPDDVIFEIKEDDEGRIWFASFSFSLAYFDPRLRKIVKYPYNDTILKAKQSKYIRSIDMDKQGNVYIGLYSDGMMVIDKNGKLSSKKNSEYNEFVLWYADSCELTYSMTNASGASRLRIIQQQDGEIFEKHFDIQLTKAFHAPYSILQHDSIYVLALSYEIILLMEEVRSQIIFEDKIIWASFHDGNLWVGFHQKGVKVYALEEDLTLTPKGHYLMDKSISSVFKGKAGGYWLTSIEEGVFYFPNPKIALHNARNGLSDDQIYSINGDGKGTVALGLLNGEIALHAKGHLKTLPSPGQHGARSINYDSIDDEFIVDHWNALTHLSPKGYHQKVENYPLARTYQQSGIGDKVFAAIEPNRDLTHIGYLRNSKFYYLAQLYKKDNTSLRKIYQDSHGQLWVIGLRGLWKYDAAKKTFINQKYIDDLLDIRIESIKEFDEGQIILGTRGHGVILLQQDSVLQIGKEQGLIDNKVNDIYVDDNNNIWIATLSGISRIMGIRYPIIDNITLKNGLPTNEVNCIYVKNDTVYAGTKRGLAVFRVQDIIKPSLKEVPLIVKSIKVNDEDRVHSDMNNLNYKQNRVEISFAALDYSSRGKNVYSYRMKGLSDEWAITNNTSVTYPYLYPGDYNFELRVKNINGQWSSPKELLSIGIKEPFWYLWWFYLIVAIFIAAIILYISRRIILINKKKEKTKYEIVEWRLKALASQMEPHFIFNALSSIQNYIITNDKMQANSYVSRFAKLMRLTLDHSTQSLISLAEEIEVLRHYMDIERVRFDGRFRYRIEIDPDIDRKHTAIPNFMVQPFIENAIWHGFPKSHGKGLITLRFYVCDGLFFAIVEDNGVGRQAASKSQKTHSSKATNVVIQRLRLLQSIKKATHDLSIVDIEDENNQNKALGTKVIIRFPYEKFESSHRR